MKEEWYLAEDSDENSAQIMYRSDTEKFSWGSIDSEFAGRVVDALNGSTRASFISEVRRELRQLEFYDHDSVMALFSPGGLFGGEE